MSTPDNERPTVTRFTDPPCTWCWGSEPVVRHVRAVYGDAVEFEFVMGGLIETFESFYDAANDISAPEDVAPHWREASEAHGMPVDTDVFEEDPPRSTYPASEAFVAEYGHVATQAVAETYDLDPGRARQVLGSLADRGVARRDPRGNGAFWHAAGGER